MQRIKKISFYASFVKSNLAYSLIQKSTLLCIKGTISKGSINSTIVLPESLKPE